MGKSSEVLAPELDRDDWIESGTVVAECRWSAVELLSLGRPFLTT